jgi:RNA polymerase sigma-70 factor (ECF subfamily)
MVLLKETNLESDAGLIEECRRGDPRAFDTLVNRYKDRIYNAAYRFLGHHEEAADVCQEVFVRAYKAIESFEGRAKVSTWLMSITLNLCRNRVRDLKRKGRDKGVSLEVLQEHAPGRAEALADHNVTPSDAAIRAELDAALHACLAALPDHYRMAFVLRTYEDLPYDEIAEAMSCPTGTVKSRLNQARRLLKDCLTARDVL